MDSDKSVLTGQFSGSPRGQDKASPGGPCGFAAGEVSKYASEQEV